MAREYQPPIIVSDVSGEKGLEADGWVPDFSFTVEKTTYVLDLAPAEKARLLVSLEEFMTKAPKTKAARK